MHTDVAGFDCRQKCQKARPLDCGNRGHFQPNRAPVPDRTHSEGEERIRAIGRTENDRSVFLLFTLRERGGKQFIRPVSARFKHRKEMRHYEEENPDS